MGPFSVWIESPADSDLFEQVGELDHAGSTEGRLRRDTKQGQSLPLDVGLVADLAGRDIKVRDAGDVVYLAGVNPSAE